MIQNVLEWYGKVCHIQEFVKTHIMWILWIVLVISLCTLLFGIKIYRYLFSGALFFGTILVFCLLLPDSKWIYVVAGFSVVGVSLAILGFHWKIGGLILYGAIEVAIGVQLIWNQPILTIVTAILSGILIFFLPIIATLAAQAYGSGVLLYLLFVELLPKSELQGALGVILVVFVAMIGVGFQKFLARENRIIDKAYLNRLMKKEKSDG